MTTPSAPDHYEVLGVAQDATTVQIRAAHRAAMREHHPDLHPDADLAHVQALNAAMATLTNASARAEYDRLRSRGLGDEEPDVDVEDLEEEWGVEETWESDPAPTPPRSNFRAGPPVAPTAGAAAEAPSEPSAAPGEGSGPGVAVPSRWVWRVSIVGVLALAPVLVVAAVRPSVATTAVGPLAAIGAVVVCVLLGAGVAGWLTRRRQQPRTDRATSIGAQGCLVALAAVPPVLVGEWSLLLCLGQGFGLGLVLGLFVVPLWRLQRSLNRVVTASALRSFAVFGEKPAGAAADMVERTLADVLDDRSVRLLRTSRPDALFTHAFVRGKNVALVRALVLPPRAAGSLRWSGDSVLLDVAGGAVPVEALVGPYGRAMGEVSGQMARLDARVDAWVVVFPHEHGGVRVGSADVRGMPHLLVGAQALPRVSDWLGVGEGEALVDQRVVVEVAGLLGP